MRSPDQLNEVTEKTLHRLTADDALKHKILLSATNPHSAALRVYAKKITSLAIVVSAVAAVVFFGFHLQSRSLPNDSSINMISSAAHTSASPVLLHSYLAWDMQN